MWTSLILDIRKPKRFHMPEFKILYYNDGQSNYKPLHDLYQITAFLREIHDTLSWTFSQHQIIQFFSTNVSLLHAYAWFREIVWVPHARFARHPRWVLMSRVCRDTFWLMSICWSAVVFQLSEWIRPSGRKCCSEWCTHGHTHALQPEMAVGVCAHESVNIDSTGL